MRHAVFDLEGLASRDRAATPRPSNGRRGVGRAPGTPAIHHYFRSGGLLDDTIDRIVSGRLCPAELPALRLRQYSGLSFGPKRGLRDGAATCGDAALPHVAHVAHVAQIELIELLESSSSSVAGQAATATATTAGYEAMRL